MPSLVIVESPAKARTIRRFLGDDYVVEASIGAIRDLEPKGLAVDVDDGFKPTYVVPVEKEDVVRRLKADVMPQLPAKRQVVVPVALENEREYRQAGEQPGRRAGDRAGGHHDPVPALLDLERYRLEGAAGPAAQGRQAS